MTVWNTCFFFCLPGGLLHRPRALLPSGLQLQHADQNMREEELGRPRLLRPSEQSGSVQAPRCTMWPHRGVPLPWTRHMLSDRGLRVGLLPLPQGINTPKQYHDAWAVGHMSHFQPLNDCQWGVDVHFLLWRDIGEKVVPPLNCCKQGVCVCVLIRVSRLCVWNKTLPMGLSNVCHFSLSSTRKVPSTSLL